MAADSNTGFNQEEGLGSAMNRHGTSFQSGAAASSSSEMIGMGNYYSLNNNSSGNLIFSGNSAMIGNNSSTAVAQTGNSSSPPLITSGGFLKHDTGLAVDWSAEEQYKLEEGLTKFADEPSILRYIKIASALKDKTVRDVALRCRWMTRKRRKQEDSHLGRKGNYRKEKMVESSSKENLFSASTSRMAAHSLTMHHMNQNDRIKLEVMSTTARQLLDQNIQAFGEINQNLSSLRLQDNIALFCRTRENINQLHAMMKKMPGRMSQMQELPVSIHLDLADSILPQTPQVKHRFGEDESWMEHITMMFNMPRPTAQGLRYDGSLPRVNV